jgi:hypothetical protein
MVLLVLVLGGAAAAFFLTKDTAAPAVTQQVTTRQQPKQHLALAQLITAVKQKITQDVPAVKVTGADEGNYNGSVSFQVTGYDFLSTVTSKNLINYAPKQPSPVTTEDQEAAARAQDEKVLRPVNTQILDVLQQNGFSKVAAYPAATFIGDGGAMYERDTDVCAVNFNWLSAGVVCATKLELTDAAKEVKPFVDVYRAAKGEKPVATAFGLLKIGTGATATDKYASVSTDTAAAYFYQQNGKWVYFTSSQEGLTCPSASDDPIAAKAFSTICRKPGEPL